MEKSKPFGIILLYYIKEMQMSDEIQEQGYQILVVNIKYCDSVRNGKDRPQITVLDVPEGIMKHIKNENLFKDCIETFAFNTITRKYGSEVSNCQVFLPL